MYNRLELQITVFSIESEQQARKVFVALDDNWHIEEAEYYVSKGIVTALGTGELKEKTEEQLVDILCAAIWEMMGFPCRVEIDVTRIDENPWTSHKRGLRDHERIMNVYKEKLKKPILDS